MSSYDVVIEKVNASKIRLHIDDNGLTEDIYQFFKFEEPTFTKNKFSKWDGIVRLFNKDNRCLPYGLLQILLAFLKDRQRTFSISSEIRKDIVPLQEKDFSEWVATLDLTKSSGDALTPHDFQIQGAYLGIKYSRLTLLAATSAGKSLILYLLCRYYQELKVAENGFGKTLVIVPNILLVSQLKTNFEEFSQSNKWKANKHIALSTDSGFRGSNKSIIISTWQSLQNMPDEYFENFSEVLVDECHLASGKTITHICNAAVNADVRIGLTGTLKDTALHPLVVQGNFGPIKRVVRTKELQNRGIAAKTQITRIILNYTTEERQFVSEMSYQEEIDFLINHEGRNKVIMALCQSLKGNSLVLFSRKDKHQLVIEEKLLALKNQVRKYWVINGDVSGEDRQTMVSDMNNETGITLLGSYVTMQAGVSINNLHNLVFGHPSKSVVQILQSIGRMLRLHSSKEVAQIYDIVDDLAYRGNNNTTLNHAEVRLRYYAEEEHPVRDRLVTL